MMKKSVLTYFFVSFFACYAIATNANDTISETTKVQETKIVNPVNPSVSDSTDAQKAAEEREKAEKEKTEKDTKAKKAKQDSIKAELKARKEKEDLERKEAEAKREAEEAREELKNFKTESAEKAEQYSIAAKKVEQREALAREKAKQDSINAANAIREKEQAEREAKSAKRLLDKVLRYALVALICCLTIIVVIVVRSRHRRKKNMDEKMSSPIVPEVENEQKPQDKNINEDTISQPKPGDSVQLGNKVDVLTSATMENFVANWVVVGASVKGNGHIQSNMPCQDNNLFESLGNGWGIAIVSDGAGSAAHSDLGSKIVVTRGIFHFKKLIENEGWIEKKALPTDIEWLQKSYAVLKDIRTDVMMVAQKNNTDIQSLSATCIVVIYSPYGLLAVHIGDGRMGYKSLANEWKPMMTPHKGEEANQTIFLVSDFWSIPQYTMSGVLVPETMVVREPVKAFALMSDGCENTAWQCTALNLDTGKYFDRNLPFAGFFDPLEETLLTFSKENIPVEERQAKWFKFIESGTSGFVKEQDDKTMIYAVNVELMK